MLDLDPKKKMKILLENREGTETNTFFYKLTRTCTQWQ